MSRRLFQCETIGRIRVHIYSQVSVIVNAAMLGKIIYTIIATDICFKILHSLCSYIDSLTLSSLTRVFRYDNQQSCLPGHARFGRNSL